MLLRYYKTDLLTKTSIVNTEERTHSVTELYEQLKTETDIAHFHNFTVLFLMYTHPPPLPSPSALVLVMVVCSCELVSCKINKPTVE